MEQLIVLSVTFVCILKARHQLVWFGCGWPVLVGGPELGEAGSCTVRIWLKRLCPLCC